MTIYATTIDLLVRFPRDFNDGEESRAEVLLEDASFWLNVWVPGLDEAAVNNEQASTAAKLLVVAMVRRNLLAPAVDDGVQSVNQTALSFQNTVTYRSPDGNLYLFQKELDSILGILSPRATSIMSPGL